MVNTTLCYIEKDGCYLMLHRTKKQNDVNHGKWIGVGGKIEPGETPAEGMLREVREETGLRLTRFRPRGLVHFVCPPWPEECIYLYTADGFAGALTGCDEGDLAWVPREEIGSLSLWPGDRIFLRLLAEEAPFFDLELTYDGDALVSAVLDGQPLPLP